MSVPVYTAVTRTQGANAALKDGTVVPRTFTFAFEEVPVLVDAFRRMVRERAYDISELALTTYLCGRRFNRGFTALPIFIVRGFHHGAILYNVNAGVSEPKDLEGKRVGVNRGYTVTTGVWARGILQTEYGVNLDRVTWMLSGDEHVAQFVPPPNVVPIPAGKKMADMLISGELAAAIGIEVDHPDVKPLVPDAFERGVRALETRGEYPINHTIVVKDELLAANPHLAADIFDAFARAKTVYLERLRAGAIDKPTAIDAMHRRVMEITGDPLPYGIEANRSTLTALIGHAVSQHIIPQAVPVEELFAPGSAGLSA